MQASQRCHEVARQEGHAAGGQQGGAIFLASAAVSWKGPEQGGEGVS